ncbi:hypothetical protein B0H10DRAFT_1913390 [Mycena sp. CBHHK59/15]|nr:hypothetical protein B0H10DRAFT_2438015 [Mycena sp. CBHHK59/15]KAJ6618662.1 hypothetical protein B0H10DRAFT_1913390 [Mycena sp. CBHHK59/15]
MADSEPFRLLDLPSEIFIHVLSFLSLESLCASQQLSHFFHETIRKSVLLQYQIASAIAQVTDNSDCLSISDRLLMLRASESAFSQMKPSWTQTIHVPFLAAGLYELSGGLFFLGEHSRCALRYVELPTEPPRAWEPPVPWKRLAVKAPKRIIDFGLAIDEHDLIVVATFNPADGGLASIVEGTVALEFLVMSTHQPHPEAQGPIEVYKSHWGMPNVILELVGDHLVFVTAFPLQLASAPPDHVYVYEWRTGKIKMHIEAKNSTYFAAVFLSTDMLLLPNANTAMLELWPIASEQTAPALCLRLPRLNPTAHFLYITARSEPNPALPHRPKRARAPFHPSAEDAIIVFHLMLRVHVGRPPAVYLLFTHRRALLALLTAGGASPRSYSEWGPDICRWLSGTGINTNWITTTSGQRCLLTVTAQPAPLFLADFNRTHFLQNTDPQKVWETGEDQFAEHGVWAEPVASRLVCLLLNSEEKYAYDSASLDAERIIAIRRVESTQARAPIGIVEVLYFGQSRDAGEQH